MSTRALPTRHPLARIGLLDLWQSSMRNLHAPTNSLAFEFDAFGPVGVASVVFLLILLGLASLAVTLPVGNPCDNPCGILLAP